MRRVGIIGGIGPESTIDYYRSIIARYRERVQDITYPEILINSIDLQHMVNLIESDQFEKLTEFLSTAVRDLASGRSHQSEPIRADA